MFRKSTAMYLCTHNCINKQMWSAQVMSHQVAASIYQQEKIRQRHKERMISLKLSKKQYKKWALRIQKEGETSLIKLSKLQTLTT